MLQLIALVFGMSAIGIALGTRDAMLHRATSDIKELATITKDLAEISVANQTTNASQSRRLDEIQRRIERLENRKLN